MTELPYGLDKYDLQPRRISTNGIDRHIDAGHWLAQERPDWVNDNIGEFLDTLSYSQPG